MGSNLYGKTDLAIVAWNFIRFTDWEEMSCEGRLMRCHV